MIFPLNASHYSFQTSHMPPSSDRSLCRDLMLSNDRYSENKSESTCSIQHVHHDESLNPFTHMSFLVPDLQAPRRRAPIHSRSRPGVGEMRPLHKVLCFFAGEPWRFPILPFAGRPIHNNIQRPPGSRYSRMRPHLQAPSHKASMRLQNPPTWPYRIRRQSPWQDTQSPASAAAVVWWGLVVWHTIQSLTTIKLIMPPVLSSG